ncbi:Vps72p KNAG_0K02120 [Huiozyma naganishii CBS 8797]|uniref:Uncharacterized protein n=1 Tax=Huiozyma naganishii (strain ATCC MYA-139 / BCRC 22969 / CBS 8797 / KCTC 17520 / NBRC 10181 / NCYC 3082 / Yp74L-3) TaxID=1071383 RepID=J7RCI4_HUIN7|nr:hypothetical protein KNAG_0K02120 [Kazachstania naganishii CBS 8797]CCK72575.1 hypothetical protein KNAG_0K02120 [Kazachstania naganishii CBS 8797]
MGYSSDEGSDALSSLPDEEQEQEQEFIMATRERRSNAGNRLQRLLEQEVRDAQERTQLLEDDEVNLLFQEDEDDEEFSLPQRRGPSRSWSRASSVSDGERSPSSAVGVPSGTSSTPGAEDEDLMLSDSGDEDEEDDDEAGERELQRQETIKRKSKRGRAPPVLKRKQAVPTAQAAPGEEPPLPRKKRHLSEEINAESLLRIERRTSKRASAVANKLRVYEKLSQAEVRRKEIQQRLKKHKEDQAKFHTLTQEDQLAIAAETEKHNLLSLNKYKEQELSQKQTRLALQQRAKLKFKPNEVVLQYLTTTWQVTPFMELEDQKYWEEQLKKREKKKRKKYPKRAKKQNSEVKGEIAAPKVGDGTERLPGDPSVTTLSEPPTNSLEEDTQQSTDDKIEVYAEGTPQLEIQTPQSKTEPEETEELTEMVSDSKDKPLETQIDNTSESIPSNDDAEGVKTEEQSSGGAERDGANSSIKQVSFLEQPEINVIEQVQSPSVVESSTEPTPEVSSPVTPKEEEVAEFEGPLQQISKNFITAYKFSSVLSPYAPPNGGRKQPFEYDFFPSTARPALLGPTEPWLRSKLGDLEDEDPNIEEDQKIEKLLAEHDSGTTVDLSFLDGFPSFGEFDKKAIAPVSNTDVKTDSIKITTRAPTGIYANNVKKHCLINDNDCQYFDPKLGIPYSDLQSYKILQDLQKPNGEYKWYGFENGGIYLNVAQRPAKGVPEGF